jgi:hypothetical protein
MPSSSRFFSLNKLKIIKLLFIILIKLNYATNENDNDGPVNDDDDKADGECPS